MSVLQELKRARLQILLESLLSMLDFHRQHDRALAIAMDQWTAGELAELKRTAGELPELKKKEQK